MKKYLRALKRMLDKRCGTVIDEIYWRFRSRKWAEAYISSESINHPHRLWMAKHIIEQFPNFQSLTEIGCASGENLHVLHSLKPEATFSGIEINPWAVKIGNQHFCGGGVPIKITKGKADGLRGIADGSVDILLTDAMLICIGPDKIHGVLKDFFRIARKGLVFMEWHTENLEPIYADHWMHNFRQLLSPFTPRENITFTKMPAELWGGSWAEHGYLITVQRSDMGRNR